MRSGWGDSKVAMTPVRRGGLCFSPAHHTPISLGISSLCCSIPLTGDDWLLRLMIYMRCGIEIVEEYLGTEEEPFQVTAVEAVKVWPYCFVIARSRAITLSLSDRNRCNSVSKESKDLPMSPLVAQETMVVNAGWSGAAVFVTRVSCAALMALAASSRQSRINTGVLLSAALLVTVRRPGGLIYGRPEGNGLFVSSEGTLVILCTGIMSHLIERA